MEKLSTPDLAGFLARVPESGLAPLKDKLAERAARVGGTGDNPESQAWASLYGYLAVEIETAQLRKLGITF
jgi:hypothetical protein